MPTLRNAKTGAVVSVNDETAARLGHDWQPIDSPKPRKSTKSRKPNPKSETADDDEA